MSQEEDDAESALVAELRALAGSPEGDRFVISRRGHAITVTHNSGSSSNVRLRASYDAAARADHPALASPNAGSYRAAPLRQTLVAPRPLAIVLRNEAPAGTRTAYATGDQRFDASVVVDTATTRADVFSSVLGPEVRAAVLALFDLGFSRVTIDERCVLDGSDVVEALLWTFASGAPPAERAARCLDAFATILDHLPRIVPSGEEPADPKAPLWVSALGWLGLAGLLGAAPAWWLVAKETKCTEEACAGPAIAPMAAILLGLVAQLIARSTLREQLGRPQAGSFARVGLARLEVFAGAASLVFFVAMLAILVMH